MMDMRDEIKLNIKKKIKISLLGYNLFIVIILLMILGTEVLRSKITHDVVLYWVMGGTALGFFLVSSNMCIQYFLKLIFEKEEKRKISRQIVHENLSSNNLVQVFPNQPPLRYYYFIKKEVPRFADYFAIIDGQNEGVNIYIKLKKNENYYFFEFIEKECFATAYAIKSDNEDD